MRHAALCLVVCLVGSVPAGAEGILRQVESELRAIAEATHRHLVTIVVPHADGPIPSASVATGLALDDSFIVTAASVVSGASGLEVLQGSASARPAALVGVDRLGGIAVLKAEGKSAWPIAPLAASRGVRVGDLVVLVASPFEDRAEFGLGTVTSVRPAGVNGQVTTEIEASTPAVPGSAGAVLVDADGRVTGLVIGRVSGTEGVERGVLAVPLEEVHAIARQLRERSAVERNWLGISVQEMTPALREILGVAPGTGVIIVDVEPGSPALRAGLELGDVILSCGGQVVREPGELMIAVANAPPGGTLRFAVLRNAETLTISATLGTLPPRQRPPKAEKASYEERLRALEGEVARLRVLLEARR